MKLAEKFAPFDIVTRKSVAHSNHTGHVYIVQTQESNVVICIPNGGTPYPTEDTGWAMEGWYCVGNLSSSLSKIGDFIREHVRDSQ